MAHGTIILAQVLNLISKSHIESLDHTYGTGRPSRMLSRWSQFGALVFAQLAGRHSLRDVVSSLATQAQALAPFGLTPPKRCRCGRGPRAAAGRTVPSHLGHPV